MFDFDIDEDLDLVFGPSGDMRVATDDRLQQNRLRTLVISTFDDFVGTNDRKRLARRAELQAERVAATLEFVNDVEQVVAVPSEENPNTIQIEVLFDTGDDFVFDI
jgi:hypothetical protein